MLREEKNDFEILHQEAQKEMANTTSYIISSFSSAQIKQEYCRRF